MNAILSSDLRAVTLRAGTYEFCEILAMYDDGTVGAVGGAGTMTDLAGYAGTEIAQTSQGSAMIHVGPVGVPNDGSVVGADCAKGATKKLYLNGSSSSQSVSATKGAGGFELPKRPWGISPDGRVVIVAEPSA